MHKTHKIVLGSLVGLTILSGAILSNSYVSADDDTIIDQVNVTVPASCSMEATGMNSHITELYNNEYDSNVGTTNVKAYCNDVNGFAIYAIGYTDDTDGKTVLTDSNLSDTNDITTGVTTSGDYSKWSMKLATPTSPEPTYPLAIQNSFDSFHTVPDEYTLVAKRTAATDAGSSAIGSTFTTTYQIYISPSQSAGMYEGQVKYVLIHPNDLDQEIIQNAVTVVFDGNGLTFPDGSTTNTMKFANVCAPGDTAYVANTPYTTVGTSNLNADGTQNGPYTDSENALQTITVPNADKVKVVVDYGITGDTTGIEIVEGIWDGDWGNMPDSYYEIYDSENISGQRTYLIDGNSLTIYSESWDAPELGYDYGFYVKIYPIYSTQQPNTTLEELPSNDCFIVPISGIYQEPTTWKGKWTSLLSPAMNSEDEILEFIEYNYDDIKGTTINLQAYNPYTLVYNGNGASSDFGMGTQQYSSRDYGWIDKELSLDNEIYLIAANYKRTGYGFIGWSTDPNAASHLNTATIYGPNETITIDADLLSTANNSHEITLYAIWVQSAGNIQNWSGCPNLSIGDVTALTDTRDNDTYAVAKLADGNCWMIENLRLGGDNPITLTTADTQSAGVLPANSSSWGTDNVSQNLSTLHTSSPDSTVTQPYDQKVYTFGNYYSWATAINSAEQVERNHYGVNVSTSICPAGWELPSALVYSNLKTVLFGDSFDTASKNFRSFPNNFIGSGFTDSHKFGSFENHISSTIVSFGAYWTATIPTDIYYPSYLVITTANYASIYYHTSSPISNEGSPYEGLTVRCVLPASN